MNDLIIRKASSSDAAPFVALIKSIIAEYPQVDMPFTPDEYHVTVEGIEEWITKANTSENSIFLVAEVGDKVIGTLICQGGGLRADRHATSLSIYVHKDWRDQGVGHALMQRSIDWAKSNDIIERIHLEVYARNQRGIHLYEKFGFEVEGRKRRAYYQGDAYIDMLIMGLLLKPERA
jgi:ribosomal protein S18 acetylase RimI-like enzyme